jgi:hypothetical protein
MGTGVVARSDAAVADAMFTSVIPEPGAMMLVGLGESVPAVCRRRRE